MSPHTGELARMRSEVAALSDAVTARFNALIATHRARGGALPPRLANAATEIRRVHDEVGRFLAAPQSDPQSDARIMATLIDVQRRTLTLLADLEQPPPSEPARPQQQAPLPLMPWQEAPPAPQPAQRAPMPQAMPAATQRTAPPTARTVQPSQPAAQPRQPLPATAQPAPAGMPRGPAPIPQQQPAPRAPHPGQPPQFQAIPPQSLPTQQTQPAQSRPTQQPQFTGQPAGMPQTAPPRYTQPPVGAPGQLSPGALPPGAMPPGALPPGVSGQAPYSQPPYTQPPYTQPPAQPPYQQQQPTPMQQPASLSVGEPAQPAFDPVGRGYANLVRADARDDDGHDDEPSIAAPRRRLSWRAGVLAATAVIAVVAMAGLYLAGPKLGRVVALVRGVPAAKQPATKPGSPLQKPLSGPIPAVAKADAAAAGGSAAAMFVPVIATYSDYSAAREAFVTLKQRYPDMLGRTAPDIETITVPDGGTWHRLGVLPAMPREQGLALCQQLQAAGHQGCWLRPQG